MRRAAKTDANQGDIVEALRRVGCQVKVTSTVGQGFPDLVVRLPGCCALIMLMEVKTADGKLTPDQKEFIALWPETVEVRSVDEALLAVGVRVQSGRVGAASVAPRPQRVS